MTPVNVTREQLSVSTSRGMRSALLPATNFPDPWPGGSWRPRDILNMEMAASRSVLSMAAKYRADYLRNFYELGLRNATAPIPQGEAIAYLIPAGESRDEAVAKMVGLLAEQGVEVFRLDSELHVLKGARGQTPGQFPQGFTEGDDPLPMWSSVRRGERAFEEAPAGSYIVFVAQPTRNNVRALFEPQIYPERRDALGEAERPYDVAGWTLPMQMGVVTHALHSIQEPATARRLTLVREEAEVRADLGLQARKGTASPIVNPLKRTPRLALYKSRTASMDEGWTRYVFDTFNIPYQSLLDADVRAGDLRARYDVIILPSMRAREITEGRPAGSYPPEYTGGITQAGVANLRRFVETGGTLICFDAATEFAIQSFNLPLTNALAGLKTREFYAPGSIVSINLDNTHALAHGLPPRMDAYFINSAAFELTDPRRATVIARYGEEPSLLRSGWLLGANRLAGKAALVEVTHGRGRIILFGFRPQHRAQTWGTFPLIFNAIATAAP
jgi:hypothetical protein